MTTLPTLEFEHTPCLVCGADQPQLLYDQLQDWLYDVPGEFALHQCPVCSHIYQASRPTQADILQFYPQQYAPYRPLIGEERNPIIRAWRRWQASSRCNQILKLRQHPGRILDVGSARGEFLGEMQHYGWEIAGTDLNPAGITYAKKHLKGEFFAGQIEDVTWDDHQFDAITMWDVLEHLPNPKTALRRMQRLLKADGYLLISVPNIEGVQAKLFRKHWMGLDPPRHLSVFTRRSLYQLLADTGFEVETAYTFYGHYTAFALSVSQWITATFGAGSVKRVLTPLLFFPLWRFATVPYYWIVDALGLGAIVTIRARPMQTHPRGARDGN